MQTNRFTHPFRILWQNKTRSYWANSQSKSFATEQEMREAAKDRPGFKMVFQYCDPSKDRYINLD